MDMTYNKDNLQKRIKANSIVSKNNCWVWSKSLSKTGYGDMCVYKEKSHAAHRWSYLVFNGEIPKGKLVCHSCDNRSCVNPEHLFLGTHKENCLDMHKKGRWCDRKGEKHPLSKFIDKDIKYIFKLNRSGLSQTQIGNKLGVNQSVISRILNNKSGYTGGKR